VHEQVVYRGIDEVLEEAKDEGVRPTAGTRSSIEKLAQARAFVPDETWDANEDILVCQNGTLEISSSILREHQPQDYALGTVPYEFDPEAQALAWHEFLATTVPEAATFLQEFAGYCLTVDTSHELAVWLYGPPGSGKSTFIEGMRAMLGDRAGLLGLADLQRSRFALSKVPGKTLLTATEQPSDFLASTNTLNSLISGEEVPVEEKFKPSYTVIPRAKILWAMNDLPRIKDANSGLFRRVKVVAFPKLRVEPDPSVKDRIRDEGAGILSWALEGLSRLKEREHFELPKVVREATEGFREANDIVAAFVKEACLVADDPEDYEEQAGKLYEAYRHWCRENGHKPFSSTAIAPEWRRLGLGERRLHGRKYYTGVKMDEGWIGEQGEDYPRR
jgi:putative DNA primase/helicase